MALLINNVLIYIEMKTSRDHFEGENMFKLTKYLVEQMEFRETLRFISA